MTDPLGLLNSGGAIPTPATPIRPPGVEQEGGPDFKDALMKSIEQVNKLRQDADSAIEDFASGKRDDVTGVMIANQKADMAFQLLLQVRNKMIDAYEEIKQIRV